MNLCLNLGIATFLKARMREKSSRRAIWLALLTTAGIASVKANWGAIDPWFPLWLTWTTAFIHFADPDTDTAQGGQ